MITQEHPITDGRRTEQALRWTESLLGARVVTQRQQERWRPQWFLDLEKDTSEPLKVVMRGFRNPGYAMPNEAGARETLRREAAILRHLQEFSIHVPKYHGYNDELGWLVMECLPGRSELTEVADPIVRLKVFRSYMQDIAVLHSQPLNRAQLPSGLYVPSGTADLIETCFRDHLAIYNRPPNRKQAEPLLEFGMQWLRANPFTRERPMRLVLEDIGPNQFMFDGSGYQGMLDFEFARVADPLLDIGLMRCREMCYPIGQLGEHIEYYGDHYRRFTGDSLDVAALEYWTIFGAVLWPLLFNPAIQNPSPLLADQAFLYSFEMLYRRAACEALAQRYEFTLEGPALPECVDTLLSPLHDLLVNQFQQHYQPRAASSGDRTFVAGSMGLALTLARGDRYGAALSAANLDEIAELIGARPPSLLEGLRSLEQAVMQDFEKDFEKRLRFFYRFEVRKEFLFEPMLHATGCSSRAPLAPLVKRRTNIAPQTAGIQRSH